MFLTLPPDVLTLAGVMILLLAGLVVFAFLQWRHGKRQLLFQVVMHVRERLDIVLDDLETLPGNPASYARVEEEQQRIIRSYVDLCAQQFHWHFIGLVDEVVWRVWAREMTRNLQHPAIRVAWREELSKEAYFEPQFRQFMNTKTG